MRTYCIAQGALFNALGWPEWKGNPKERGDIDIYILKNRYRYIQNRYRHIQNIYIYIFG